MEAFLFVSFVVIGFTNKALAQITPPPAPTAAIQNYYTPENQKKVVSELQQKIVGGCTVPLAQQPGYPADELQFDVDQIKAVLQEKFSKSFVENPNIKTMLDQSLDNIASDATCTAAGNDCRTRLVATATYYFQKLRPNVPGCENYVKYDYNTPAARKKLPQDNGYIGACETEIKLRGTQLSSYGSSNGGMDQRAAYADNLTNELNNALIEIQQGILTKTTDKKMKRGKIVQVSKDSTKIPICGEVESGVIYSYPLRVNLNREAFAGFDSSKKPEVTKPEPKECVEEITVLHEEFVPMNFAEGVATAGNDQVKKVKQRVEDYVSRSGGVKITDVEVVSSSSKTPYRKSVGGKLVFEKEYSDAKNLELANRRAGFANSSLASIIQAQPELKDAKYSASGAINGPDYSEADAALKNITNKDPDYKAKVEAFYQENKEMLLKDAMIKSSAELMDAERFTNLYDVKYKPYQGFKITVKGFSKATRKCPDMATSGTTSTAPGSSTNGSNASSNKTNSSGTAK